MKEGKADFAFIILLRPFLKDHRRGDDAPVNPDVLPEGTPLEKQGGKGLPRGKLAFCFYRAKVRLLREIFIPV